MSMKHCPQKNSNPNKNPGKDKQANWLPAPNGPFYGVLRLYMPKPEVASGEWKMPQLDPVNSKQ